MFFLSIRVYYVKCKNACTGFGGTVLGQDYLDTALEFLISLLVAITISLFFILFIFILVFIHWTHLLSWGYIKTSYHVHTLYGLLVGIQSNVHRCRIIILTYTEVGSDMFLFDFAY